MSLSSSSTQYYNADEVPLCDCINPSPSKRRVSWTKDNPGQRFYNCEMYVVSSRFISKTTICETLECGKHLIDIQMLIFLFALFFYHTRIDCGFFQWMDPPVNAHYRQTLPRLKREDDGEALADTRNKLAAYEARVAKLKLKLDNMKNKAATLKNDYEELSVRAKVIGLSFVSVALVNGVMVMMKFMV
ncbi:hypothetical protein LXL04_021236 [Taraxacum kok-saghyz]